MRHNPETCQVCNAISNNPGLSNVQLARMADTSERSVRRHKTPIVDVLAAKDEFFQNIPEAIITSRGQSIRTESGSWQKVTYRPQDLAMYEAMQYDDLEKAIAEYESRQETPRVARLGENGLTQIGRTEVLCLSDFQLGKVASGGGTKDTVSRILTAVDKFWQQSHNPEEIVLVELGDILENFDNVGSQRGTNDLDLTLQIRTARKLLLEILLRLHTLAPKVTMISIPSNHCQVRLPGGKDLASTPNNDWGIELSHQIEDVLVGRPGYGHVRFVRTEGFAEAVTHTLSDGTVLAAVHGHQAQSQDKVGEWWKGQSHGRRNNLHNADILLYGHFHNFRLGQSGDARWLLGTPSSDGGSDWFTNKTGEHAQPGMVAFTVINNQWTDMRIL